MNELIKKVEAFNVINFYDTLRQRNWLCLLRQEINVMLDELDLSGFICKKLDLQITRNHIFYENQDLGPIEDIGMLDLSGYKNRIKCYENAKQIILQKLKQLNGRY